MAYQNLDKYADKIEEIIYELTDDEVISLATTITGGLLKNKISCRQGEILILCYLSDP